MSAEHMPGRYVMKWILERALAVTPPFGKWVEVGCGIGKGIATMGEVLREAGREDVQLYAVDPWAGTHRNGEQQADAVATAHGDWKLFIETMRSYVPSVFKSLHVVRLPSVEAARAFAYQSVSLVIIDGDHSYEGVADDLTAWWSRVRPGGIIGGDDHVSDFPGVEKAVKEAFGSDYETRDLPWRGEETWTAWMHVVKEGAFRDIPADGWRGDPVRSSK